MSKSRFQSSRFGVCLAALFALAILGGCSAGTSDGGEIGGGGGLGGGGGGGGGSDPQDPPPVVEPIPVLGLSATLSWAPASGPVFGYQVLVSRNDGGFTEEKETASPSVQLTGAEGDVVQVRVAAFDSERNVGPLSAPSDKLVFLGGGDPAPSGDPPPDDGGTAGGGTGSTEEPPADPVEEPADPPAVATRGDIDADGADDLVWQSQDGAYVRVTSADLTRARVYTLPAGDRRLVAVDDFDGDGASDLLFAGGSELSIARGTALRAAPGALELQAWGSLPEGAAFAAAGDFDADGIADAAVVEGIDASLWLGAGDVLALPSAWYEARIVGAGDADADGHADLLWRGGDGNLVLWRIAAGALAGESAVSLPEGAAFVVFGDLDGNGAADVASQSAPDSLGVSQAVAPFTGWVEAAPSGASLVGCGDYDGDGTRDRLWADANGLRVVAASGELQVSQDTIGPWRLHQDCR